MYASDFILASYHAGFELPHGGRARANQIVRGVIVKVVHVNLYRAAFERKSGACITFCVHASSDNDVHGFQSLVHG